MLLIAVCEACNDDVYIWKPFENHLNNVMSDHDNPRQFRPLL